jgi:hypothetical protein
MTAQLETLGYRGLKDAAALAAVLGPDPAVVVDVRHRPFSWIRAWSTGTKLTIEEAGYEYLHLAGLGNAAYKTGGTRIVDIEQIEVVLDILATGKRVVLLCACPDFVGCHRLELAHEAERRVPGLSVYHHEHGQPALGI